MHEFAPSRRGIFTTEFEDDDEDYEVYYYFPTQNRLDMVRITLRLLLSFLLYQSL